jgi:hypothetical protein
MKFQKLGKVNPNMKNEIKPMEFAHTAVFKRLDYLLGYLLDRDPKLQREFVARLTHKLKASVKEKGVLDASLLDEYSHLKEQLELAELHLGFSLQLLQISGQQVQEAASVEVPGRNYFRGFLVPRYYQALVLSEIIGKDQAIHLFKAFIDQYTSSLGSLIEKFDDLETMQASHIEWHQENPETGWIVTLSDVEDGRYLARNDNCPWIEALDDLEDVELVYLVCCYGDFQYATMHNEHFVITRRFTIAEGDPCCDKVFHDKRIVSEVKHPGREFFEKIDSRLEQQKV